MKAVNVEQPMQVITTQEALEEKVDKLNRIVLVLSVVGFVLSLAVLLILLICSIN